MLAQLLQGRWPLEDQGLFDRTHLRWFTRHSIVNGLRDQGLVVHSLTPRVFNLDRARTFVRQMEPDCRVLALILRWRCRGWRRFNTLLWQVRSR